MLNIRKMQWPLMVVEFKVGVCTCRMSTAESYNRVYVSVSCVASCTESLRVLLSLFTSLARDAKSSFMSHRS